MRRWLAGIVPAFLAVSWMVLIVVPSPGGAQTQPQAPPDFGAFVAREDLAAAGDTAGARRILRFVQVSDAHVLDDDAPYPLRQELLDPLGDPFTAAQRPQEEYTDEVLEAAIRAINALHAADPLDLVINTGDNIDNDLENELMRFLDNWEGTVTTVGPVSGLECLPDGQSADPDDASQDVTGRCTSLPESVAANNTALAPGLPWLSAFGNHDGLIQGNVPAEPGFNDVAGDFGRRFLTQPEYVGMHFAAGGACAAGVPAGVAEDDFGHGYGHAGERLCDGDPDNDGYYAFSLRGVRFVVLDTVNDDFVTANTNLQGLFNPQATFGYDLLGGYAEGSVDPAQFAWLLEEVETHPAELVLVFSHHTVNSMFTDSAANPCGPPGCLSDLLTGAGYKTGPELVEALSAYPNVVAWIGGHTHQHLIQPKSVAGAASPGFWNVETSSLIDLPQEARVVEVWATANGTKGFLLLRDFGHGFSLSRELAAGDPQADPDAAGAPEDRDTLLWFGVPSGVALTPMPDRLPDFQVRLLSPGPDANGTSGQAGEPVTLLFEVQDGANPAASRGGLEVSWTVAHQPPGPQEPLQVDVPEGSPLETTDGPGPGPWVYGGSFTPPHPATYYVTVTVRQGGAGGGGSPAPALVAAETFSLQVGGTLPEGRGEDSPGLALPAALAALAALSAWRRQNR